MRNLLKIVVLTSILSACYSSKKSIESNETIAPTEIIHGEAKLQSISTLKMDTVNLMIQYSYFKSNASKLLPYQDSINYRIIDFIQANTEFETAEKKASQLDSDFFYRQLVRFDSLSRMESDLLEEGNLWELEGMIQIVERKTFSQLELNVWTYTGGAHGNGYTGYFIIEHSTGKELGLSEFILDLDAFTQIAEKYFRLQNEIDPMADLTELGFWFTDGIFRCNENFYFDDDNINFLFNNYEIAPYSAGQIHFSIPLSEIRQLLKIQP